MKLYETAQLHGMKLEDKHFFQLVSWKKNECKETEKKLIISLVIFRISNKKYMTLKLFEMHKKFIIELMHTRKILQEFNRQKFV